METRRVTITEGLAEIKTITKRIEAQKGFVVQFLTRYEAFRDPLEADGGSPKVVAETRQSISDLTERLVSIRTAIAAKNASTELTVEGRKRSVQEWLIWRRDAAPIIAQAFTAWATAIKTERQKAQQRAVGVREASTDKTSSTSVNDLLVNLNEKEFYAEAENYQRILDTLDGQLSLLNATTYIEI